jgi:DNA repair protein RecO (recombination protein O)
VPLIESEALVVRTVEVRESDVVATVITEQAGKVGLVVRGARKGSRRVGGALEPAHTIGVLFDDKGAELCTLKESRIVRLRAALVADLDALEAAGVALRWARHLFPPRTLEPEGWQVLIDLLDRLDEAAASGRAKECAKSELARAGLALLAAVGYALELEQCVVCGRPCPEERPAYVDPARGGLVCRSCGGAHSVVTAEVRAAARALGAERTVPRGERTAPDGERTALSGERTALSGERTAPHGERTALGDVLALGVLNLVERAMAAHTGFER